jgi:dipeptidyl aminopeptidase/acylaminoacyl peptidase
MTCLVTRQTPRENPNFYVLDFALDHDMFLQRGDDWRQGVGGPSSNLASLLPATSANRPLRAITAFPHPAPGLLDVQREIVYYERADGVRLNGNLYLPPGYDVVRDGPLPVLIWAYPREFKSAEFASQTSGSPYRFVRLARTPLYWLTQGYAILDGPSMPIIGQGDKEANDSFRAQLVQSAEAAVDFLVERGIASRDCVAIGGASYGAFMTTNLLAHAPDLFCCGIARSGAFNRTLTPFGFQAEERTIWQAPDVYLDMSPILYADRFKAPLLLIHGDADSNPGTFPLQSERMYQALKGNGKIVRYVSLPHEGHGYRARESVMHTLAEMTDWLNRYCKRDNRRLHSPSSSSASLAYKGGIKSRS